MKFRVIVSVGAMLLIAVLASVAGASDTTQASASIASVSSSAAAWASGLLIVGFVTGIIMVLLSPFMDIKRLIAVPIFCIIVGALLAAGPAILAPFSAMGATLR